MHCPNRISAVNATGVVCRGRADDVQVHSVYEKRSRSVSLDSTGIIRLARKPETLILEGSEALQLSQETLNHYMSIFFTTSNGMSTIKGAR